MPSLTQRSGMITPWKMKVTLEIDADVLQAAEEIAAKDEQTVGAVISDLVRKGLKASPNIVNRKDRVRNGVHLLPSRDEIVTLSRVRELMEDE